MFIKKIRGEVVPFLFIMPIWLFLLAFLGLQYNRITAMNSAENAARNAIRVAIRAEDYDEAFTIISSIFSEEGIDLDGDPGEFLNIYEFDGGSFVRVASNDNPLSFTNGNILSLSFETEPFLRRGVNEICFMGDNCVNFFRDRSPINIRAVIE